MNLMLIDNKEKNKNQIMYNNKRLPKTLEKYTEYTLPVTTEEQYQTKKTNIIEKKSSQTSIFQRG